MTTRTAGGLDFTAIGGKRQGREGPQSFLCKLLTFKLKSAQISFKFVLALR
jgi:hypothetical protein